MTPTGQTRDVGWECGVRRTFRGVDRDETWALLRSPEGLTIWLGGPITLRPGPYELADGTTGEIRVDEPGSHLRLTWRPPDWDHDSTVQVRVLEARTGTTISFHHERLADAGEREAMLARWDRVLAALGDALAGADDPPRHGA